MKKQTKKSIVESLKELGDRLCYQYTFKRDGGVCQVQKYFPLIHINHSDVMQSDHCFSRSIKELFFDVANRTLICSTCNAAKGSGKIAATKKDAVTIAVHEIVKYREGLETYDRLFEIGSKQCVFKDWSNPLWLEMQIKILGELLEGATDSEVNHRGVSR